MEPLTDAICQAAKWLKSSVEKLSKKSLGGVTRVEIAGIPQRNEPSLPRFVGF